MNSKKLFLFVLCLALGWTSALFAAADDESDSAASVSASASAEAASALTRSGEASPQSRRFQFLPIVQADLQGAYSALQGQSTWGSLGDLVVLPMLKFGKADYFIPTLYADYTDQFQQVIEEDSFFAQRALLLFKPAYRHQFGAAFSGQVEGAITRAFNNETRNEAWGTGLYDYEEYSGGLGSGLELGTALKPFTLFANVDWVHRSYDNFHELGPGFSSNKNYYVKDYQGPQLGLDWRGRPWDLAWHASYYVIWKQYTDSYQYLGDGTLDFSQLRQDFFHLLTLQAQGPLGRTWQWDADCVITYNNSNENYYDFTAHAFETNFYSYISESLRPSLHWLWQGKPEGGQLGLAYELVLRNYPGRSIRNPDGTYTQGKQADTENNIYLDASYPLKKGFSLVGGASAQLVNSNQGYVQFVQSTYQLYRVNFGLAWKL